MKKTFTLLIILATALSSFAQDTITGVVNRIAAPYFEQNVCDTRFAITTDSETYYVMVDNYWPNPYLEDLVIHYDTIAIRNEIEVIGNILEMEDGNGEAFQTISISKNLSSTTRQIMGFYSHHDIAYPGPDTITAACFYHYNGMDGYYITIHGELQAANSFAINGRTLVQGKRYLFFGKTNTLTNYNGNSFTVIELADALPYDVEDFSISGTLTKEDDSFLSVFDGDEYHYLTNKRKLINNYINEAVFMEGDSVVIGGYEFIRYDLYGNHFNALEVIKLQSETEHILVGGMGDAPMPYIGAGPPLPGLDMALISETVDYYLKNPNNGDGFFGFYVVDNDTIQVTSQQLKATLLASIFINNYQNILYSVYINQVEFEEHEETLQCTLAVASNPFYWGNILVVRTQDDETYYLKQFIYEYTAPDHITVGNKTVYVGDSFTATGMVSNWYYNAYYLKKVIDITSVEFDGIDESYSSEIQIFPNPSNGMIKISSEKKIDKISVCDYTGRVLFNKSCNSEQINLDLQDYKGLAIIQIVFENGQALSRKIVIH